MKLRILRHHRLDAYKVIRVFELPHDDVATVLAAEGVLVEARDDGWVFDGDWFRTRQRLEAEVMTLHG